MLYKQKWRRYGTVTLYLENQAVTPEMTVHLFLFQRCWVLHIFEQLEKQRTNYEF
jgi:hypothetical protein